MDFELLGRDGAARLGRWRTPHGTVRTPALLPVVHPGSQPVPAAELAADFGVEAVIANAYIVWRSPALRARALRDGVRGLLGFPGPVFTDSGTFQAYVYGRSLEVDNATIVSFEREIGATVGTILDVFTTPDMSEEEAARAVEATVARAREAQGLAGEMGLALPVQGGLHRALRARCARELAGLEAAVHPIGGVVPLLEGQRYRDLVGVVGAAQEALPPGRPVHLFGAGHPIVFPLAALLGCDLFDSAGYSKYARDGRYMLPDATLAVEDLGELPCPCPACARMSARDLRAMPAPEREAALARHNLHVSLAEVRRVREAIRQGRLWELVEQRARAHPRLLDALRALRGQAAWIERREPLSKPTALFYTGPETLARPAVLRLRERLLERYRSPCRLAAVVEAPERPFGRTLAPLWARARAAGVQLLVRTPLAPVPLELDEMYPVSQSGEPDAWDRDAEREFEDALGRLAAAHGWKLLDSEELAALPEPREPPSLDEARVAATADMQFGLGAAGALLAGEVRLRKSGATGRVRNVLAGGAHVLSLRAADGLFTLKLAGARRLHAAFPGPRLRVAVTEESAPFQREGRNAMARFVASMDPGLRPGDEALVVTEGDELLGVGRVLLNAEEARSFRRGVAVELRESAGSPPQAEPRAGAAGRGPAVQGAAERA